jgi:arsenate reductase (thioredoxin)
MAEGFARTYGPDVLSARSAGLAPAMAVVPLTHQVMMERNIDLGDSYPKQFEHVEGKVDLIINMSGYELPARHGTPVETWQVRDPIGESIEVFRRVRDEIDQRVQDLIERLRSRKPAGSEALQSTARPALN